MASATKSRLDTLLVERGLYRSRSRARDAIARGCIFVDGNTAKKPGHPVDLDAQIAVRDDANVYVSRSALKLIAGLDASGFDPAGKIALDIGASTGGFTQVLLERGAVRVFAVDVGHGQMDDKIAVDPRVTHLENRNARELIADDLEGETPEFIVCDVSFISLRLALPPALDLAVHGTRGIFLIKPQFELGREHVSKGGLIKNQAAASECAAVLAQWLKEQPGWRCTHLLPSPIPGGDGNREFLMAGVKE